MKTFFLYLLILIQVFHTGCAQTKTTASPARQDTVTGNNAFELIRFIPGDYLQADADVLDNLFLITIDNQLKKFDAKGDSVAVWNDVKSFGNPAYIDITNPLKILVYYKAFSTVVILDRLLNPRNTINFRKQNIFTVKAVATSYDNNIWLFDEQDFKLKKTDEQGKVLTETVDWRQLFDPVPLPEDIIDHDNFVYLYDPARGFYIFDYYGSFKNTFPLINWQFISVSQKRISGFRKDHLLIYDLNTSMLSDYPLPPGFSGYISIKAVNGKVYVLKKNGVYIYRVK